MRKYIEKKYEIKEEVPLIIFKIDYYQSDSSIPINGYEVFHPINKTKLNLSFCRDEFIHFNIPVSIDENKLFKYDPDNDYYKDECYPYTTDNDTDILIKDRKNEFIENNMSLCEKNCTYIGYDIDTKKAKCKCMFKNKDLIISELVNQTDFSYIFANKEESSNIITMKCVQTLFTKEGLLENIGSYILLFTILLFLISIILFCKCGYNFLEEDINTIIEEKKEKMKSEAFLNINETIDIKMKEKEKENQMINKKPNHKKKKKKRYKLKKSVNSKSISKIELKTNKNMINFEKKIKQNISLNFNDYEYNSLSYTTAIKYDERTFINYYFSLIKTKHPFIFSFFPIKDYNSIIVKIDLFFLSLSVFSFINCLFFDESIIHKIYIDEGVYDLKFLIQYITYSFIISHTITTIIKYFSLSERNIGEIKKEKNSTTAANKAYKVAKCIKIKYIIFYCLSLLFLFFFWYYLSSFGAVFQNTQKYLIKNILISFSFSLAYPFIINIFPSILRIYSLKDSNRDCIFKLSIIIQFI